MPSTGRYRVLALASTDLLDRTGVSSRTLQSCANLLQKFPLGVIELLIVHPLTARFEWVDLPKCVKDIAEMRLFGLAATEDLYDVYGVPKEQGAMVVVRPDGYVGMIGHLSEVDDVEAYFRGCLVGLAGDA
jgi:phenol 2-monooxygenase